MSDTLDQADLGPASPWSAYADDRVESRTGTGTTTITMAGGETYVVAHNRAEVARKLATTTPGSGWVGFDLAQPGDNQNTVVLDTSRVVSYI